MDNLRLLVPNAAAMWFVRVTHYAVNNQQSGWLNVAELFYEWRGYTKMYYSFNTSGVSLPRLSWGNEAKVDRELQRLIYTLCLKQTKLSPFVMNVRASGILDVLTTTTPMHQQSILTAFKLYDRFITTQAANTHAPA